MLKSFAREPLVHFLLLGALLFALDAWLRPAPAAGSPGGEIVISEARVRSMAQNFARTWQRTPTREEIDGLVESFVREEVMVREALALGLDRDDPIIRRRLQQKVEFVSEQSAALARPTDDELRAYLKAHPEAFVIEPRVTFEQITLDPTRRADAAADARRLLEQLNRAGGKADATALGDRLLLLEPRYEAAPQAEVARLFGAEFAAALPRQPVGRWAGPIASGYGLHLVRIEGIEPGGAPTLDEVRPQVEREWTNARRQELSKALYDKLRAKYTVTVRMPEAPKP
jgi:hypothetical protein